MSLLDKTIKLWKLFEKNVKSVSGTSSGGGLSIPRLNTKETVVTAVPRRVFSNAHAYHINSISLNSDCETYISADDLRINLWNLEIADQSFNIVDIKPSNMEELTEVITSAEFHPKHCNIFMYSSSKGTVKLGDMRDAALCDTSAKVFEEEEDASSKSFFSEIISSISDCRFSRDGRYILSRDYLTLKVIALTLHFSSEAWKEESQGHAYILSNTILVAILRFLGMGHEHGEQAAQDYSDPRISSFQVV